MVLSTAFISGSYILEALTAIFSFLYPFWPLILLLGLRRIFNTEHTFNQRLKNAIRDIFLGWLVWLILRFLLIWRGKQPVLILPEAVDRVWFFVFGAIFGGIYFLLMFFQIRKNWIRLGKIKQLEDLILLSPEDFEKLVAKLFRSTGLNVIQSGGHADHGVDLEVINKTGEKWIVQCKRYSGSVGEPVVRDLYGTLLHEEAQGAYLITTGTFTKKAQDWAAGKPIVLYDGEALLGLIREIQR